MHKSTSPKRKSFRLYALLSAVLLGLGSVGALIAGVTPATAANLATQPDTQEEARPDEALVGGNFLHDAVLPHAQPRLRLNPVPGYR